MSIKIKISPFKTHATLAPELWVGFELKEDVREALERIAEEFYKHLEIEAVLKDIKFTGSMANFNYAPSSDIDLHLVINFEDIAGDEDLIRRYFSTIGNLWNKKHAIKIKDHEVEIYVENEGEPHVSTGVYSIQKNEWIIKPEPTFTKIDMQAVRQKAETWIKLIEDTLEEEPLEKFEALRRIKEKIKKMRQCGLEKGGEYSTENLVFKILRRKGFLKKIGEATQKEYDKFFSLPENKNSFQSKVKKKHARMKFRLIGKGGNKTKAGKPFYKKPSYKRSKNAPAGFGALQEE